jgi:hypothetical protein
MASSRCSVRAGTAIARRQLLAAGVSEAAVDHRLGTILHPVHAGVYAVGHPTLTTEGRWLGAVLACGPGAALSHRAAAAHWGLRSAWLRYREVSAPRSVKRVEGVIVHRRREIERTIRRGIPVTTVSRTIVDVADVVSARTLRAVLEQAEILRLDCDAVPIPGRRGYGRLARAIAEHGPVVTFTPSRLEREFLEICREAGVPAPRANGFIEGMESTSRGPSTAWPSRSTAGSTTGLARPTGATGAGPRRCSSRAGPSCASPTSTSNMTARTS